MPMLPSPRRARARYFPIAFTALDVLARTVPEVSACFFDWGLTGSGPTRCNGVYPPCGTHHDPGAATETADPNPWASSRLGAVRQRFPRARTLLLLVTEILGGFGGADRSLARDRSPAVVRLYRARRIPCRGNGRGSGDRRPFGEGLLPLGHVSEDLLHRDEAAGRRTKERPPETECRDRADRLLHRDGGCHVRAGRQCRAPPRSKDRLCRGRQR